MPGTRFQRIAIVGALVGLIVSGDARAETWVVDDDGKANFKSLAAAVAAATDGDTLLLRPGRYEAVSVTRKGLRILGSGASLVTIERTSGEGPFFEARELTAGQRLVLSGVTGIGRGATLVVERCAGLVLFADLVIESRHPTRGGSGPMLADCANATLARVAVLPGEQPASVGAFGLSLARGTYLLSQVVAVGAPGAPAKSPRGQAGSGAIGLVIDEATVAIAHSEFVGGAGGAALWDERAPFCPEAAIGGAGGAGMIVSGESKVLASFDGHGALRGGDGGAAEKNPWDRCWSFAGDGGPGVRVRVDDALREIVFTGDVPLAGDAGTGDTARAGNAGVPIDGAADSIEWRETPIPTLAIDQPGVCGGGVTVRVHGPPASLVTLIVASELGRLRLKGRKGFTLGVLPGGYWQVMRAGRTDDRGELVLEATIPATQAIVGSLLAVQASVVTTTPRGRRESFLSNVDVITIADGSGPPTVAGR